MWFLDLEGIILGGAVGPYDSVLVSKSVRAHEFQGVAAEF